MKIDGRVKKARSSAYARTLVVCGSLIATIDFTKMLKREGESTEPCGVLDRGYCGTEVVPWNRTRTKDLSRRKLWIQERGSPVSLFLTTEARTTLCSVFFKALSRSIIATSTVRDFCFPYAVFFDSIILPIRWNMASIVERRWIKSVHPGLRLDDVLQSFQDEAFHHILLTCEAKKSVGNPCCLVWGW